MKNKFKNIIVIAIFPILLSALMVFIASKFTDAKVSKMFNMGSAASLKCYSGGVLIYDGRSTGKVESEENSDGYYFVDNVLNKRKEVSGDCDITYDN